MDEKNIYIEDVLGYIERRSHFANHNNDPKEKRWVGISKEEERRLLIQLLEKGLMVENGSYHNKELFGMKIKVFDCED